MRDLKHVSPSMVMTYEQSEEEFYLRYRADSRPPRDPQTLPMAIGSAFDAYVKAYLLEKFWDQKDQFERIFKSQVEEPMQALALQFGGAYFDIYREQGGLADMVILLQRNSIKPLVELDIRREINFAGALVPVICKPDLAGIASPKGLQNLALDTNASSLTCSDDFKSIGDRPQNATRLVHDWKVNKGSPKPGYVKSLPSGASHRGTLVINDTISGIPLATHFGAGAIWDDQLSFYGICCFGTEGAENTRANEPFGFIGSIDQITHDGSPGPKTRTNEFRKKFSSEHLSAYARRIRNFWESEGIRKENSAWELKALALFGLASSEDDADFKSLCAEERRF
jgi:hypothetical protein